MAKIDNRGNYCYFPGVTVVCPISEESNSIGELLYSMMTSEPISRFYSALPSDSYHMTTMSICDWKTYLLSNPGKNTVDFINSIDGMLSMYQKYHSSISSNPFRPVLEFKKIIVSSVIILEGTISTSHADIVQKVATEHSLNSCIPWAFHVTLGYQYKSVTETEQREVYSIVKSCLETNSMKSIQFDTHELCYYNDMTKFIPWDAKKNMLRN